MIVPPEGTMELAQARLSARFGGMADEVLWSRMGSLRELKALFDLVRTSRLSRWVRGIVPDDGPHAIEAALRERWRNEVQEVMSWMPPAWQPAVLWCSTWFDRPILHYLAHGQPAPQWLQSDPAYSAEPERDDQTRNLRRVVAHDDSTQDWCVVWRQRVPDAEAPGLADLARFMLDAQTNARLSASSVPARKVLRNRLVLLFRRTMLQPAAAFAYLAITAVDLERLRGELLRVAIFGPSRQAA